jgi:carboxyl-terminal processing protease
VKLLYILAFLVCATSCKSHQANGLSTESRRYIDEVLALLKEHSVKKHETDWVAFTDSVYAVAKGSKTVEDTYPAIAFAIKYLGDSHSYFSPATGADDTGKEASPPVPEDMNVPEGVGYIRLPFCMGDETQTEQYITTITEKISTRAAHVKYGWIVDLRDNYGGNMWPMLAAIGPLLEDGVQGYFVDAGGNSTKWIYRKGAAMMDTVTLARNHVMPGAIKRPVKLAVLTNARTASSGEAMAVVFKGVPNARSFGERTFGVSTGCESFTLSDGSHINLATTVFADRNKSTYGSKIEPDAPCGGEEALKKAVEWICK